MDPKEQPISPPDDKGVCIYCGYDCDADTDICDVCAEEQYDELMEDIKRDEG